jgi:hypothetical protein
MERRPGSMHCARAAGLLHGHALGTAKQPSRDGYLHAQQHAKDPCQWLSFPRASATQSVVDRPGTCAPHTKHDAQVGCQPISPALAAAPAAPAHYRQEASETTPALPAGQAGVQEAGGTSRYVQQPGPPSTAIWGNGT